jgi:hypothetical protein
MNATHHFRVDQTRVLPKIFGTGFDKRGERVEMTRDFQDSRSNGGKDFFHVLNDPVIEGVNGAVGDRFANAPNHQRLDVLSLDLDVNPGTLPDRIEHVREGRDSNAAGEEDFSQLGIRHIGYGRFRPRNSASASHRRIVVYDYDAVARRMDIQL